MRLHDNKEYFKDVLDYISIKSGISPDIIEKDYYVSMMLSEIATKQKDVPMAFKGGTALYKISSEMRRFSEDIDLTVDVRNLSNSQAKRMLEKASNKFESLSRLKGDEMEENKKGSITAIYGYDSVYPNKKDILQRFGKIKVESTSFTVSEPTTSYEIASLIYMFSDNEQRKELEKYNISSFQIETISIERMFVDKLLAAEFYLEREHYFDVAKHLYDIHFMYSFQEINNLLNDEDKLIEYLSYKRAEETERIGSNLVLKPLNEFNIYNALSDNDDLQEAFNKMQDIYVFDDIYKQNLNEIQETLNCLKDILFEINDKEQSFLNSEAFENFVHETVPNSEWKLDEYIRTNSDNNKDENDDIWAPLPGED